ncbi:hypothetical protein TRFO_02836 [Tritrichomonas foetus]|uniref:Uncharacterized protein n=1 Tax=Tritrichomonas foetus TaxID=1144522 RepID=A0A1J4KWA1_9EUKA|nr:hypothetical protein TRFO_02836 [Tritrichomonas foetus]|eukprot:OHT15515.1 hypothetical protein TRFO_02836 [Tritrichomonas foetus]
MKKLEDLKRGLNENNSLNDFVLSSLNGHIKETSPNPRGPQSTIDNAISDLLDVLDARSRASSMIRQQLTDENSVLRDKISKAEAVANEEIKQSRQRRLDTDHKYRQKQKQISQQISQIRTKIEQQSNKFDDVIEENQEIENSMKEKKDIAESLMEKLQDAEQKKEIDQKRLDDLRYQLNRAETSVKAKEREIEAKRASQRFGIGDADESELEIIRQLENEISLLFQENQAMSLELKKRKLMNGAFDFSEISKL